MSVSSDSTEPLSHFLMYLKPCHWRPRPCLTNYVVKLSSWIDN